MTTVHITFRYQGELDPKLLPRTQEDHSYFGIRQMKVDTVNQRITVEYDATRLDASGVFSVLRRVGIPVVEQVTAT